MRGGGGTGAGIAFGVGEAFEAQIEIGTDGTADARDLGEVGAAVVALVESSSLFGG